MISKRHTSEQLTGQKAILERDIRNGAGYGIGKGAIVTITSAHYGINIVSDKCPHCQQSTSIARVAREDLTLLEDIK